jgi:hypothetical protein
MKKQKGFILYEGPSRLDGAPIVVVATMSTNNAKTGDMVQTWIMRSDIEPHKALETGADSSVCGDCVHRPANQGSCYVTVFQAPLAIYRAYHRGAYSHNVAQLESILPLRKLRIGAYGDPAAAPADMWLHYADLALGNTGYTHQIAHSSFQSELLGAVMVSADTEAQAQVLQAQNIRYFRTIREGIDAPLERREVECLSDSKGLSCAECLLCDGGTKGQSVYINIHGSKAAKYNPDLIAVAA